MPEILYPAAVLRRVVSAYRRHGPAEFLSLVGRNLLYALRHGRLRERPDPTDLEFDNAHGIDIAATREIGSLDVPLDSARHAVRYQPSDRQIVQEAFANLEINWPEYTFVDYGSGKGLVLLLASHYPYKRIIGVEFSAEMREIAEQNIATYTHPDQKCHDLTTLLLDASDFVPPTGPLVCYFYNPFRRPIMEKVLSRLEERARADPSDIRIVYIEPREQELFERARLWVPTRRTPSYVVYAWGG